MPTCRVWVERTGLGLVSASAFGKSLKTSAALLPERRLTTPAALFAKLSAHYAEREAKPFSHIVVDEAQDLGVPDLRGRGSASMCAGAHSRCG